MERMNPRQHSVVEEFCKLVSKPDLLTYLGLEHDATAEEARAKLKARRRYMQGMQGNPKYKAEALALIKNYSTFDAVLASPSEHLAKMASQQESEHLPVFMMTLEGIARGSDTISEEQITFLRRNALELGISESRFEACLEEARSKYNLRAEPPPQVPTSGMDTAPPVRPPVDHYQVLGISRGATSAQIRAAYEQRLQDAIDGRLPRGAAARIETAWTVLGNTQQRGEYDARAPSSASGPASEAETLPPVRPRPPPVTTQQLRSGSVKPEGWTRSLEILGEPTRHVKVSRQPYTSEFRVRATTRRPLSGSITSDVPWLTVQQSRLDPTVVEQSVIIEIDPRQMRSSRATGTVTLDTDLGERASIQYNVERSPALTWLGLAAASLGALALAGVTLVFMGPNLFGPSVAKRLTITVNPSSEKVLLDGQLIGSGSRIMVEQPTIGTSELSVHQMNFEDYRKSVELQAGRETFVTVTLKQTQAMDYRPTNADTGVTLTQAAAERAIPTSGFKKCLKRSKSTQDASGAVLVYVCSKLDGAACGVVLEGDAFAPGVLNNGISTCLKRHAATTRVAPSDLDGGDYAALRYRFTVSSQRTEP